MHLPETVRVSLLPRSIEEFTALRDQIAGTPQGGAALMVIALLAYVEDEAVGQECLAIAVDAERLQEGRPGYEGWGLGARDMQLIQMQIRHQPHIPSSYIRGATPVNGYELPHPPYQVDFQHNPHSGDVASGEYKVFVVSSGADSARPVAMRRDERGMWKAREWSSLLVGVRQPL